MFRVPDRGSGNPTPLGGWDSGASGVDWLDGSVQAWQPYGLCKYHLVWVTKYRYPVLGGDVGIPCRELLREPFSLDRTTLPARQSSSATWWDPASIGRRSQLRAAAISPSSRGSSWRRRDPSRVAPDVRVYLSLRRHHTAAPETAMARNDRGLVRSVAHSTFPLSSLPPQGHSF